MAERTQTIKVFNKRNPVFTGTYRKVTKIEQIIENGRKIGVIHMADGSTASFPLDEWMLQHKGWTEYEF